jgi:hypothetical protein
MAGGNSYRVAFECDYMRKEEEEYEKAFFYYDPIIVFWINALRICMG